MHVANARPLFLGGLEKHLATNSLSAAGPFVIGNEFTYADMVIYQISHDEGLTADNCAGLKDYPRLQALCQGVEKRPNVAAFRKSERYLG